MARKTCPLCGRITLPSEPTCMCGFDFGLLEKDPPEVRRMLARKVTTSGMQAAGAFLGALASAGIMIIMPPFLVGAIALLIRGGTQLTTRKYAKRALLAHDAQYALPVAKVHRLTAKM